MSGSLVSVVIVTMDNKAWLIKTLKALEKQKHKNLEIFVIDNGSRGVIDGIKEKIGLDIEIISTGENLGYGRAANIGLRRARGKYALLWNDDALCGENYISYLASRMDQDDSIGASQGTVFFENRRTTVESAGSFFTWFGVLFKDFNFEYKEVNLKEREVFCANLPLVRMSMVRKIGFFDEDYFLYFEDADLCWRIWISGGRVMYFPEAYCYHVVGMTSSRIERSIVVRSTFLNRLNSILKNLRGVNLLVFGFFNILFCCGAIFAYLLTGNFKCARAVIGALMWNVGHIERTNRKRGAVLKYRKMADYVIFRKVMKPMKLNYFWVMAGEYLAQR